MNTEKVEETQECQARGRLHALPQTETGEEDGSWKKTNQATSDRKTKTVPAVKMVCYTPAGGMKYGMGDDGKIFPLHFHPSNTSSEHPSPTLTEPSPSAASQRSSHEPNPRKEKKNKTLASLKTVCEHTLTHEKEGLQPSVTPKHTLTNTV